MTLHTDLLFAAVALALFGPLKSTGSAASSVTLDVEGKLATIERDDFGLPHIFAPTNRSLFVAYGYAVAQDRLWQLELNRRAARGRLAEIFGSTVLPADRVARRDGYADAELDDQFSHLSQTGQEIFEAYRDGINRYLEEVVFPNPLEKPFEFHALGFTPELWEIRDSVAFGVFMTRRFGEIGGRELRNRDVLSQLIGRYGEEEGYGIFNDLRWIDDPDAPVTVPPDGGPPRTAKAAGYRPEQLLGASQRWSDSGEVNAQEIWQRLGVVTKLGSYAWVVSPETSADGTAMLYGGPQMGFSVPEVLHEVQLTGGSGFNIMGMAFAGVPAVLIGRNDELAWTSTTATGDNVDTYLETLCGVNQYIFNKTCTPMESRVERINVRGADPDLLTVLRTVHGPVVSQATDFAATQKRAHWQREVQSFGAFLDFDLAQSLSDFEAAIPQIVTSHNFLYADRRGNIAYWQAGQVPLRPEGFDPRLPLPGDGRAEWTEGIRPVPTSINPDQGYLANWNNKPELGYPNADSQILGKQFRVVDLQDDLSGQTIALEDMESIPKDIARFGSLGRESRYFKPYLLDALAAVPPSDPLADQAIEILKAWDGYQIEDAVMSRSIKVGEVIFSRWLADMIFSAFEPALGADLARTEASSNMLLHVLDDALGPGSGVPPSRNYFEGREPQAQMSATFDQALGELRSELGQDPTRWTPPRPETPFDHPIPVIGRVATILTSNRSTYGQIVQLDEQGIASENIFTLGQSGFIQLVPPDRFELDPHFLDQLPLYRNFEYKPMQLLDPPK
jgi:penicillin amidase